MNNPEYSSHSDSSTSNKIQQELTGNQNQVIGQSIDSTIVSGNIVYVNVYDKLLVEEINKKEHDTSFSKEDYRNQKVLLNKVKNDWIRTVLENSLYQQILISLDLEERIDLVEKPFDNLKDVPERLRKKSIGRSSASSFFFSMGQGASLLILGAPGSGKTIMLLKLAKDLVERSENEFSCSIPVIFNLSSWNDKSSFFSTWLVHELDAKYSVSKGLGRELIDNQRLVLLLDGLDEVKAELREKCIQSLNHFINKHGQTEIVICSRFDDYKILHTQLRVQSAVCIQPLNSEQIGQFFLKAGEQLAYLSRSLKKDSQLRELAKTPLFLSLMCFAYQNNLHDSFPNRLDSVEQYHYMIFNSYVERMLSRREGFLRFYSKKQFLSYITSLSLEMIDTLNSTFLIESMQPGRLCNNNQKFSYHAILLSISAFVGSLGGGFCSITAGGLIVEDNTLLWHLNDALGWIPVGITLGGGFGFVILGLGKTEIEAVEALAYSPHNVRKNLLKDNRIPKSFLSALIFTALMGFRSFRSMNDTSRPYGLGGDLILLPNARVSFAMISAFTFAFSLGIGLSIINSLKCDSIESYSTPNQGIWRSLKNAVLFTLFLMVLGCCIGGLVGALIGVIYFRTVPNSIYNVAVIYSILYGMLFCLIGGFFNSASRTCIQHLSLRINLFFYKVYPWNIARFLNFATENIFLQRVGGGYIFMHRTLLEYFANNSYQKS